MGRFVLALAAILALDLFAADIVILKDGKTYEGTFAGATADHVRIRCTEPSATGGWGQGRNAENSAIRRVTKSAGRTAGVA